MTDPTTTLFTFMLQTHPSVQSVHLVGSWDNFCKTYTMERDVRRDRGQWRGCHSFKDIVCDGNVGRSAKRNGGLKMGQTYYYYYELDGATESHDPALPSTTSCPFLPGQRVNTLHVPVEQSLRTRSASLNSLRNGDHRTVNPKHRFVTPRPPPTPPVSGSPGFRLGTAPNLLRHKPARSLSPTPVWPWSPRKLFTRKGPSSRDGDRDHQVEEDGRSTFVLDDAHSVKSSEGSRSRDISPDSLRRFLVDDAPLDEDTSKCPSLLIPEDIAEENEDDDNFATSATSAASETVLYTGLSPPPLQRGLSSTTILQLAADETPHVSTETLPSPEPPVRAPPKLSSLSPAALTVPRSHFSFSSASSVSAPASPQSPDSNDLPSFYHSESEEDDSSKDEDGYPFPSTEKNSIDRGSFGKSLMSAFHGYSLPRSSVDGSKLTIDNEAPLLGSPALIARNGSELPVGNTSLLATPAASGLDDLVNELGWMADVIHGKDSA